MNVSVTEASLPPRGAPVLSLPAYCDLAAARLLLPELRRDLGPIGLAIDGLGVREIDLAMLQLLASARLTAAAAGMPLAIVGSSALHESARVAGLERILFGAASAS